MRVKVQGEGSGLRVPGLGLRTGVLDVLLRFKVYLVCLSIFSDLLPLNPKPLFLTRIVLGNRFIWSFGVSKGVHGAIGS